MSLLEWIGFIALFAIGYIILVYLLDRLDVYICTNKKCGKHDKYRDY